MTADYLDTVEATGSIPVSPTTKPSSAHRRQPGLFRFSAVGPGIGSTLLPGPSRPTRSPVVVGREHLLPPETHSVVTVAPCGLGGSGRSNGVGADDQASAHHRRPGGDVCGALGSPQGREAVARHLTSRAADRLEQIGLISPAQASAYARTLCTPAYNAAMAGHCDDAPAMLVRARDVARAGGVGVGLLRLARGPVVIEEHGHAFGDELVRGGLVDGVVVGAVREVRIQHQ